MATKIFPTVNDVGGAGSGKVLTEANLAYWLKQLLAQNFILSGFTVPGSSVDLTLSVAPGEANIAGYRVVIDSATTVTCTASATNHIYLKLTRDASQNVTSAEFEVNTTGTPPADSVKIATAVAGASSISSTTDARQLRAMAVSQMDGATPDQTQAPASPGTGTLAQALSWFANRIKAITGATNWWDAPATTLATANTHIGRTDNPHVVTTTQIGAETPVGAQAKVDTHGALTTGAHGGIVASSDVVTVATANKLLKLDAGAKLPASITGDADTVDGIHGTAMVQYADHAEDDSVNGPNLIPDTAGPWTTTSSTWVLLATIAGSYAKPVRLVRATASLQSSSASFAADMYIEINAIAGPTHSAFTTATPYTDVFDLGSGGATSFTMKIYGRNINGATTTVSNANAYGAKRLYIAAGNP